MGHVLQNSNSRDQANTKYQIHTKYLFFIDGREVWSGSGISTDEVVFFIVYLYC